MWQKANESPVAMEEMFEGVGECQFYVWEYDKIYYLLAQMGDIFLYKKVNFLLYKINGLVYFYIYIQYKMV